MKGGSTGTQSVYTKCKGFEIMYHVSTLLPFSDVNTQQLESMSHPFMLGIINIMQESDTSEMILL